jgi:Zn-dependent protease with chaperone function
MLSSGKVFVFSGILPICNGEDGLAAVLGHEIAHNVAHHSAENMSRQIIVLAGVLGLSLFGIVPDGLSRSVADLALFKPGSRKQEVGSRDSFCALLTFQRSPR